MMINDANKNPRNPIAEYVRLIVKDINNSAITYIVQQARKAQKSVHVYHLIYNYITESAHLKFLD